MNNHIEIKAILEKYFEGHSSLEEEQLLKSYFQGADIAPEHEKYRLLFQFLVSEKEQLAPKQLSQAIYSDANNNNSLRVMVRWSMATAASILLAVSLYFSIPEWQEASEVEAHWAKYEVKDPEKAAQITRDALLKVSRHLNKGTAQAAAEVEFLKELMKK